MEYRTLLCLLCVCWAFAEPAEQNSTQESSTIEVPAGVEENVTMTMMKIEDVEGTSSSQIDVPKVERNSNETGKPRDKRTLNMILRGLANILGYTVSPIQVASLPNPEPTLPPLPPAPLPKALNPVAAAPTPPPPSQRETLKLTGVLNFGTHPDLLDHLAQYEKIFHGNNAPAFAPAPTSKPKPPIGPPVLVKIPNPIAPNLPPPLLPAPAPRPTQPLPLIPRKQEYETEYRKSENLENYKVENKELRDGKEVMRVPNSKYTHDLYIEEPRWKQHYEDRLTELERKQSEHTEKLKQYEEKKTEPKEYADYEDTISDKRNREKEIADRDRAYAERLRKEEEERRRENEYKDHEDSRERHEERDRPYEGYSGPHGYNENYEEEPRKYKDYDEEPRASKSSDETGERSEDYKRPPGKFDDYEDKSSVSDDSGKSGPEEVRNSYGESLEKRGQVDENISGYFSMFKNPKTGVYEPERVQASENERKEPWWDENGKGSSEKLEEHGRGYSSPAPESKYEEYNLDEVPDRPNSRTSDKLEDLDENLEPTRETYTESRSPDYSEGYDRYEPYSGKVESEEYDEEAPSSSAESNKNVERLRDDDRRSDDVNTKNEKIESEPSRDIPYDEFDLTHYKPYYVPVRYIYRSDELDKTTTKILSAYENDKESNSEDAPEDDGKESRRTSEEDLTPKIGLPERLTTKNLHEGESKEFQVWPAPFDHVFDSTEQTKIAEVPSTPESKVPPHQGSTYESSYQRAQHENQPQTGQSNDGTAHSEAADHEEYHGYSRNSNHDDDERAGYQEYPLEARSEVPSQSEIDYANGYRSAVPQDDLQRVSEKRGPEDDQEERNPEHFSEPRDQKEEKSYPRANDYMDRYRYGFENENPQEEVSPRIELQTYSPEEHDHRGYDSSESQPQVAKSYGPDARGSPNALPTEYKPSSESRASKPDFYYSQAEPHVYGRRFDKNAAGTEKTAVEATSPTPKKLESAKKFEDPASAHDYFGFSKDDYRLEGESKVPEVNVESTSASTKDKAADLLTVPDPPDYQYDEKLTEFTDDPESDTEKVKVKEYRNKVATVKVSELKQLSPNGPVQLIGYTRNF